MDETPWMRWLVALLVAAHGFVYLSAARGVLPIFEGWRGTSWLLGRAVTGEALKQLSLVLWAVAGVGIIAAGVAMGFAPDATGLWRTLAAAASAVGIASFFVFWDGQVSRLFEQGVLGVAISLAILASAIAWSGVRIPPALVP